MYNLFVATPWTGKELLFRGTLHECRQYEDMARKKLRAIKGNENGEVADCWVWSDEELEATQAARDFWNTLTPEDKKDIIEIDGKQYIRKIWERNHQ